MDSRREGVNASIFDHFKRVVMAKSNDRFLVPVLELQFSTLQGQRF
jgi:hypothetical protein